MASEHASEYAQEGDTVINFFREGTGLNRYCNDAKTNVQNLFDQADCRKRSTIARRQWIRN